jgi:diguanylate cyclase (GGDEF)-like protein
MPKPPPSATFLMWCTAATAGWSLARRITLASLGFLAAVLLEISAPPLLNVTFLYLLACVGAILCLGERWGLVLSLAGACASTIGNHLQFHELLSPAGVTIVLELQGLVSRMLCFGLLSLLVHGLSGILELERWRATHDGLTGALNKQAFEVAMRARAAQAKAEGRAMVFIYLDLDGFKGVNDQHGHAAGDGVLQLFAGAAVRVIRAHDLFARIGGDEFALLLTLPPEIDGARVAELLHGRLTQILHSTGLPVTCSMGALALPPDMVGETGALFEQADALMYEAKRGGKDGVRIARGGTLSPSLRSAYSPLPENDKELESLLAWVDQAERRMGSRARRAA